MARKNRWMSAAWMVSAALVAAIAAGCAVSKKTAVKPGEAPAPLQNATKEQLVEKYDNVARAIQSLNAAVTMKLTAGTAYTGVIEQYHEVKGFILAQRPANIRAIGQAPVVGKNIFDMVSDGETFHIFIPSKNKFLVGAASFDRPSAKPIESLRPQHLLDALFWQPVPEGALVLFEEANEPASHSYVLTIVRPAGGAGAATITTAAAGDWEIALKIWFDRADLNIARIEAFGPGGRVNSDVRYRDWQTSGAAEYPRQIALTRPGNDYQLGIGINKLTLNETIAAERFVLEQPAGTELVRVGEEAKGSQP
jgi:outer membrane lipoprotein-sorting protein